ncbi:MAG: Glycosyl transferase, group 2 family protein [Anaerolineae bacterium]|jgi:glycosyltransferase involved in cell wall biosynthesis|nr:MAG: Glycosyl transferase, group 2 family protein [Anaerolineae bacterium]
MNPSSPLLALCMIVKNEAENLPRCLDSVKDVVDEMIIVDTGSTDNTKEIASSYGAKVYDFEWVNDFSVARNYSIDQAKAEWILVLDADEALETETAKRLRGDLYNATADAYILLRIEFFSDQMYSNYDFAALLRLFRNRPGYRYERAYHEEIDPAIKRHNGKIEYCYDWVILHYGLMDKRVQGDDLRHERAIRILTQAIAEKPNDPNLYMFMASEYYNKGNYDKALELVQQAYEVNRRFGGIHKSLIHMGYNILGYIFLLQGDSLQAEKFARLGIDVCKQNAVSNGMIASHFYYRHSLGIQALACLDMAFKEALDGKKGKAISKAQKAIDIFTHLKNYSDQPRLSIERLDKLITQATQLISMLR